MPKILGKIFQLILLPLVIAGAFFLWSITRITTDYNFNADELIYLSRSSYWEAFKSGDFANKIWSEWGAYDQPQLTNYVYTSVPGDRQSLADSNSPCSPKDGNSFYATWSCLDGLPLSTWPSSLDPLKNMVIRARTLATGISALAVASTYYLGLIVAGPLPGILAAAIRTFSVPVSLASYIMISVDRNSFLST